MKDDIECPAHPCFVLGFKLLFFHVFSINPKVPMSIYLGYFIFIVLTAGGFVCLILRHGHFKALSGLAIQAKDKEILRIFFGH
jgi:hypothetical protein